MGRKPIRDPKAQEEREMADVRSGEFLLGTLIGSLIGAAFGLLLAPQAGKDTREQIKDKASQLVDMAKDKCSSLPCARGTESAKPEK